MNRCKMLKSLIISLSVLGLSFSLYAQQPASLPRSAPEAQGVSSQGIIHFLDAVSASSHELHSFMMLRHGQVIAEGWWNPYRPDLKHTLYSTSKSFTATAVGLAVAEKKLTVNDKVISFFPDDLPATASPNLAELRIKDLLSMSVGHLSDPTGEVANNHDNWVKAFLATPVVHQPGTQFLYNSMATYMLSAIVQKVTGEKIVDYLQPRLFDPLGIKGIDWETDPRGINTGGWGLRVKTEDMARFGQLFLQKGRWQGKQILPATWVDEATSSKIDQEPGASQTKRDSNDWVQGYCYQVWRCRHNAFRADGAFGQFIIVMPDQDAVFVITAETSDMQSELNLVWEHILPAIKSAPLPADADALKKLQQILAALALPLPPRKTSALEATLSGAAFNFAANDKGLQSASFEFKDNTCRLTLKTAAAAWPFPFGAGQWQEGETARPSPYLIAGAKNNRGGLPPFQVAGCYTWSDENTLQLTLRYIESPHTETIRCRFDGDQATFTLEDIFNRGGNARSYPATRQNQPAPSARLIIRGDDMGYTHAGNQALIKCHQQGIVTSIEVMTPAPWFPEAVKLLGQNPGVDVGVHLTLTCEWENLKWRPLTACPSLTDSAGYFYPFVWPNPNYPGQSIQENKWKLDDIEKEFRAQIQTARQNIPRLSHLSSHMGCSVMTPEVKALTARLAQEYRLVNEISGAAVATVSYDGPAQTAAEKVRSFTKMLDQLQPGKTYLFVDHPGFDNEEMRALYHIGYETVAADRQGVTDLFTNQDIKALIQKKNIQRIGFKDL